MGLPDQMLMDNGSPWGLDRAHQWSSLGVWLLRLGIGVAHGRPYHPQTCGKVERLHQTLKRYLAKRKMHRLCEQVFMQKRRFSFGKLGCGVGHRQGGNGRGIRSER